MIGRAVLQWATALAVIVAVTGCSLVGPTGGVLRYKMTVEIETPQGARSGSAVRDVTIQAQRGSDGTNVTAHVRGEAVAVQLSDSLTIYALLRNEADDVDYGGWIASASGLTRQSIVDRLLERPIQIYPFHSPVDRRHEDAFLPMIVTFPDQATPLSMRRLDARNLATGLGAGYRLRRILIQRSGDAVGDQLDRSLPWLDAADHFSYSEAGRGYDHFYPLETQSLRSRM